MLQFTTPNVTLGVPVPLDINGQYITGDALHQHIIDTVPVDNFSRFITVQRGIPNVNEIHSMVGQTYEFNEDDLYKREMPVFALNTSAVPHTRDSDLMYIEMLIDDVLRKKGLIS